MQRRYAPLVALGLACLACGFVLSVLGDGIYWNTAFPPGKELRAALAVRDNVTPFQKWGSALFTQRYLKRYYGGRGISPRTVAPPDRRVRAVVPSRGDRIDPRACA